MKSGIDTNNIITSHITLRDQISSATTSVPSGAIILDVRPAGVTVLPDAYLDSVNNDSLEIISDIDDDSGKMTDCKSIISQLYSKSSVADMSGYNQKSLAQNIVCQYVLYQRLERRIDLKRCLLEGKGGCN